MSDVLRLSVPYSNLEIDLRLSVVLLVFTRVLPNCVRQTNLRPVPGGKWFQPGLDYCISTREYVRAKKILQSVLYSTGIIMAFVSILFFKIAFRTLCPQP